MERKADVPHAQLLDADFGLITAKEGMELVRSLAQWPDVFLQTYKTREPVTVLIYLFKMTHLLSGSYDVEGMNVVRAESAEKKAALMALYHCARQVLANGLMLLGLTPIKRMEVGFSEARWSLQW